MTRYIGSVDRPRPHDYHCPACDEPHGDLGEHGDEPAERLCDLCGADCDECGERVAHDSACAVAPYGQREQVCGGCRYAAEIDARACAADAIYDAERDRRAGL